MGTVAKLFAEEAVAATSPTERGVDGLAGEAAADHVRALARICPLAIVAVSFDGRVIAWNPAAEKLFGWTAAEVLDRPLATVPGERWDEFLERLHAISAGAEIPELETRRRHRDGRLLELRVTATRIADPSGAPAGAMAIYQDVTDQKRREEEQRRALDLLQAIVDGIPAPIFYKDTEGAYLGCNAAFCAYTGETREQIVGKTVYDKWPRDLAATYDAADRALLASRATQTYEAAVRYADGTRRDVVFHKGVFFQNGAVAGQVGTILDITERKRAETALRESERRLARYAFMDAVTQLPNRAHFENVVAHALEAGGPFALLYCDLDGFKRVNDELGHAAGDQLLQRIAGRFRANVREGDVVARQGGDEFTILLGHVDDPAAIHAVAARILDAIRQPVVLDHATVRVGVSIGCAIHPHDGATLETLTHHADAAMYRAKQTGKNRICFHEAKVPPPER